MVIINIIFISIIVQIDYLSYISIFITICLLNHFNYGLKLFAYFDFLGICSSKSFGLKYISI